MTEPEVVSSLSTGQPEQYEYSDSIYPAEDLNEKGRGLGVL
ncbi:MAG TPA: hypothetical protein VEB87_05505 [Nitrososphaerales archaeon]|nr:hypothetical protein [Nitrososphaerales archaeon]